MNGSLAKAIFFGFFVALNMAIGLALQLENYSGVGSLALAAGFFTTGLLWAIWDER